MAVPIPDSLELSIMKACMIPKINWNDPPNTLTIISIWYADVANAWLHSYTKDGMFCVTYRDLRQLFNKALIGHVEKLWESGLYPIEIIHRTGTLLYALPKKQVLAKDLRNVKLVQAQTTIPKIWEFADVRKDNQSKIIILKKK